jgi:Dehydrogenase E1 component
MPARAKRPPAPIAQAREAPTPKALLRRMYAAMVQCRAWRSDFHSVTAGQPLREAMLVGSTIELQRGDIIAHPDAALVAALARGFGGAISSNSAAPEAATAIGAAAALKLQGRARVVVAFARPDASAIRFAAGNKLPVIFVTETPLREGGTSDLKSRSNHQGVFFPAIPVDGNDIIGVFRVAHEAQERARIGHGPALIQCIFDAPPDIVSPQWDRSEPVRFLEAYLQSYGLWSDDLRSERPQRVTFDKTAPLAGFAVV